MTDILDSHIHLWPSTSVSPTSHGWMTPGHSLARRHGISDYLAVTKSVTDSRHGVHKFIYVETDRYLPSLTPWIVDSDDEAAKFEKIKSWAKEPLEELKFLRRIVQGRAHDGDGFLSEESNHMAGCVIWAPFNLSHELFIIYLTIAQDVAGPQLWSMVVGFRYLLQAMKEETEMRKLVESEAWQQNILNLRDGREGRGRTFDLGVDAHSGGIWQLDVAVDMIDQLRELESDGKGTVKLILNHFCKPDLSHTPSESWNSFSTWTTLLDRAAAHPGVYMKFSGAFNEFSPSQTPGSSPALAASIQPFVEHVFKAFSSRRVMFGSDWPVCNVGGPAGEENWRLWKSVVEKSVKEEEREDVLWKAGCEAYGVELQIFRLN